MRNYTNKMDKTSFVLLNFMFSFISTLLIGLKIRFNSITETPLEKILEIHEKNCFNLHLMSLLVVRKVFTAIIVYNNKLMYSTSVHCINTYLIILYLVKLFVCNHYTLFQLIELFAHVLFSLFFVYTEEEMKSRHMRQVLKPYSLQKDVVLYVLIRKTLQGIRLLLFSLVIIRGFVIMFIGENNQLSWIYLVFLFDFFLFLEIDDNNLLARLFSGLVWIVIFVYIANTQLPVDNHIQIFYAITKIMMLISIGVFLCINTINLLYLIKYKSLGSKFRYRY